MTSIDLTRIPVTEEGRTSVTTRSGRVADDDVAMDPQDALRQLIESDGFRLFLDHVRTQWGAAAINRKTKEALKTLSPSDHSAAIQAIHGTAESIVALFAWPEDEYERLAGAERSKAPVDRFAPHRRTP